MAYVSIEADERMEEGPDGLQFKSFLETDARQTAGGPGVGNVGTDHTNSGYIPDRSGKTSFWQVEHYQSYFDIDTKTVLRRCYLTLIPTNSSFLSDHLTPADLYGPFWTLTTLIFSLFVFSSLASSIAAYMSDPDAASPTDPLEYNFGLLSIAVGLVYSYGLAVPVLLWLGLRYLGVGEWSVVETVALWGYGQFVWIPVSLLCVIPVPLVRWILVGLAFLLSGYFLISNTYPILAAADQKAVRLVAVLLVLLHAGLALCFKILFFSYYAVKQIGPADPL
ncbi:Yip1-domain-containing protein [Cytidiella melzeri]|nr:Yip1-domain-containing protein [Cytidiella melzeri]